MFSWRCIILLIALAAPSVFAKKKVVCYLAAWSAGRPDNGRFTVLDSDTEHCTHVVYAFMGLNESSSEIMTIEPYVDTNVNGIGENSLEKLKQLKLMNSDLKVMVSIGGYSQGSKRFSNVAKDQRKRLIFINSVLNFLKKWELDGVDMCWQFPTQRGGIKEDKENSLTLLKELKKAFKEENYILSIHMLGKRYVMDSYKIKEVSDVVDFINLMAVEYNGPWDRRTGIMAPLLSKDENNVEFSVSYMLMKKVPRRKLNLGMPTYGHAHLLEKEPKTVDDLLGQHTDQTFSSKWTNQGGIISYTEYCLDVNTNPGWTELWDEGSQTPIAYNGRRFVSIDNGTSLLKKAELVASKSLGGVAFWSLDMDDFLGLCDGIHYPLVSTVSDYLQELPDEPEIQPEEDEEEENEETEVEQESEGDSPDESVQTTQRILPTVSEDPNLKRRVTPDISVKSDSTNYKDKNAGTRIRFSETWVFIVSAIFALYGLLLNTPFLFLLL